MESTHGGMGIRPPTRRRLLLGLLLRPGSRPRRPKRRRARQHRRPGPKPLAAAAPRHEERGKGQANTSPLRLVAKRALVAVVQEFGQLLAQHLVAFVAMPKEDATLE